MTGEVRAEPRAPGGFEMGVDGSRDHRREPDRLSDPAEGARHRLPARQPALLAAQHRVSARSARSGTRSSRRSTTSSTSAASSASTRRFSPPRSASAAGSFRTEYFDEGNAYLAQTGPAVRRGGRGGVRKDLHLRPDLPRREIEDAPAPHRVLDDRAGGRVERLRRQHAPPGGLRLVPRAARARAPAAELAGARARHRASSRTSRRHSSALDYTDAVALVAEEGKRDEVGRRPGRRGRSADRRGLRRRSS